MTINRMKPLANDEHPNTRDGAKRGEERSDMGGVSMQHASSTHKQHATAEHGQRNDEKRNEHMEARVVLCRESGE